VGLRESEGLWLPFAMDRVAVYQSGATAAMVHVCRSDGTDEGDGFAVDVTLTDEQGQVLADVRGLRARPAEVAAVESRGAQVVSDSLYRVDWPVSALPTSESTLPTRRWLVVGDEGDAIT